MSPPDVDDPLPVDVAVLGLGAVGARVARQLQAEVRQVMAYDPDPGRTGSTAVRLVEPDVAENSGIVVLAQPGPHVETAERLIRLGRAVVSTSDDLTDITHLLDLAPLAEDCGGHLVLGATMAPGLSGLLARHLMDQMDSADEVHVATHGTGGPSCARQHHRSLGGRSVVWRDGEWLTRPAGSGRELCWFPEPIGPRDCYRAEAADPVLLHRVAPSLRRISARVSGTRRDRLTARLPMLSPPHREGGIGALRVEVRGVRDGQRVTAVAGTSERSAIVAAAVAATLTRAVIDGTAPAGLVVCGQDDLPTAALLREVVRRGLKLYEFVGSGG